MNSFTSRLFSNTEPREDVQPARSSRRSSLPVISSSAARDLLADRRRHESPRGSACVLKSASANSRLAIAGQASARAASRPRSTSATCRTFVIAGRSLRVARHRAQQPFAAAARRVPRPSRPTPRTAPSRVHAGQVALVLTRAIFACRRGRRRSHASRAPATPRSVQRRRAPDRPRRPPRRSIAPRLRLRPMSTVSRRPAVSTSVTRKPVEIDHVSVTRSRVVPGTSVTIARAAADERVEQARLADVRRADDRDLQPLANQPPAPAVGEQRDRASQSDPSSRRRHRVRDRTK